MGRNKIKILKIEIFIILAIAICTIFRLTINKYFTAGLLTVSALLVFLHLKKRRELNSNQQKVYKVMAAFAILYVALYYVLGIYTGFYHQTNFISLKSLINYIIPIIIIIVSTEVLRDRLLLNNSLESKVCIIVITTLADISIYLNMYNFNSLDSFLALVGFVTFAAISNNILYTYISDNYGMKPVLIYKLITYLYLYFIPVAPNVYIYFRTFVRMIYPLIIYMYLDKYYNLDDYKENAKIVKKQKISLIIGFMLMLVIIALISCKFLYGILVIGSESMTGSIDKGDVVLFKSKNKNIEVGDVIVFKRDDLKIVHRVVEIKNINHTTRYYTKGDANNSKDEGYVTKDTLIGKVLLKIKYIGKPTLWLREIFDKEG